LKPREIVSDVLFVIGAGLSTFGIFLLSEPWAFIFLGAMFAFAGARMSSE